MVDNTVHGSRIVGGLLGSRPFACRDRPACRQARSDGRVLGEEVWSSSCQPAEARGTRWVGSRGAGEACRARRVNRPDRRRRRSQQGDCQTLADQIRHETHGARGRRATVAAQEAKRAGLATVTMQCPQHGESEFWLTVRGDYRCKRCRSEAVSRRRRRVKETLVKEAGGRCRLCGYDRNMRALHFHHVDPSSKRHEINAKGVAIALDKLRVEARKCVLLCSNCHAEVEDGMAILPTNVLAPP
jgi:hypothetical protein